MSGPQRAKYHRKHSKLRALQRHGLGLNRDDLRRMREMIQTGKATFLYRKSNRLTVFRLVLEQDTGVETISTDLVVYYDSGAHEIATVLPKEAAEVPHG